MVPGTYPLSPTSILRKPRFTFSASNVVAAVLLLSTPIWAQQKHEDAGRPALRILLPKFATDCEPLLSDEDLGGFRQDLEYELSALPGIAVRTTSVADNLEDPAAGMDELVARYDGNTVLQVRLACAPGDRLLLTVRATRIAPGGADAEVSESSEPDALSLRNALRTATLGMLEQDTGRALPPPDAQAFELYLGAIDPNSGLSHTERLQAVREATRQDSRFDLAWLHRGTLALTLGEEGGAEAACYFAESDTAFREALRLYDALPLASHGLASVQMRIGQTEAAAAILRAGLIARPDFALLHSKLAYVNRYAGLMRESISGYRRSQALDGSLDNLVEAERQIVKSHIYSGEFQLAFASYRKIVHWLDLSGRAPDEKMLFYQGVARSYAGETERATELFDASIATKPGTVWSDFAAAYRSALTGEIDESMRFADGLAQGNVTDGERRYRLAHLYSMSGQLERALFHLDESARSGFFNYPYTKSDRFLANISESREFGSTLQFIQDRHSAFTRSASELPKPGNTYEKALSHALGLDYRYLVDHGTCAQ
jgi:tetratricopeptide (TPR) repeat protein